MKNYFVFSLMWIALIIESPAQKKDFVVTIKTREGDMVAILYDETPKHKQNFIKLAKAHYFDSLLFHRVIASFMIQGGDPNSKKGKTRESLGNGGPGYTIQAEFNPKLFHKKGVLSAARLTDQQNPKKESSGSQFYIVQGTVILDENELKYDQAKLNQGLQQYISKPEHRSAYDSLGKLYSSGNMDAFKKKVFSLAPQVEKETGMKVTKDISPEKLQAYTTVGGTPFLDNEYTVFGQLIKGLDVLDKIAAVKTDGSDRPVDDVRMMVTVQELSKKKITKIYGYKYLQVKK